MTKTLLLLCMLTLTACGGSATVAPAAAPLPTGVVDSETAATPGTTSVAARPALTTEMLPSFTPSGRLKAATNLLQRPTKASVILKALAAGDTVQILGDLDNSDGQWLSIAAGEVQGWVRAAEVSR